MSNRERTRVLHVISSLSTYGAERLVAALADAMPSDEFDVAVMTLYTPAPAALATFGGNLLDIGRRRGSRDPRFFPRMVKTIRTWRPALVNTHVHNGKYWGRLAAVVAGAPVIVHTEHNPLLERHPVMHAVNRLLYAKTARVVALSKTHAARIETQEDVRPEKVTIIANGITVPARSVGRDEARRRMGADDRAVVLAVGRFEPVKNQRLAVDAFDASPSLRKRARMYFAGNGVDEPAVRQLVAERGLERDVVFLGYRNDVNDLLAGADVLAMPTFGEGMPLTAIEAMMARVPIVTAPWDGNEEFFEAGRFATIAASYSAADFASALEENIARPEAAQRRAEDAFAMASSQYTIAACAQRYANLYRSLT